VNGNTSWAVNLYRALGSVCPPNSSTEGEIRKNGKMGSYE